MFEIFVLFSTLFASVNDKLVSILPYHRKHQCLRALVILVMSGKELLPNSNLFLVN